MTKKELINNLRIREGLTWGQTTRIVNSLFNDISDAIINGEDVYIPKFGRFFTAILNEKRGVHPKNKKVVITPTHPIVRFRMSEDFKRRLKK